MLIGRLVSINPDKAKNIDLFENSSLTIGRGSSCSIRLDDNRCSSTHCKLTVLPASPEHTIEIEDLSTNGTFIDSQKIGKGNKQQVPWTSQLDILRAPQVDEKSKIGWKLELVQSSKRKNEESKASKQLQQANQVKDDIDDKLRNEIICQICMELIYQPVSLYPCLHNFCGGCFSDWHNRGNSDCPTCRQKVNEVKKNHLIVSLVDVYSAKHPEAIRTNEELKDLDLANKFKQDRVVISKSAVFKSDGSPSSSDDEEIRPARGRGSIARGGRTAAPARVQAVQVQNVCKQCTKAVEGFRCSPGQAHLQCFNCKNFMPDRGPNQRCAGCDRGFCNLYWRAGKCRVGISTVDSYKNTIFTALQPSSLNENKFEQNVVNNYVRSKGLSFGIVSQEMMDSMEVYKWKISFGNPQIAGHSVALTKQSYICDDCAGQLWDTMLYKYREVIENDLDPQIKNRPKCWYGKDCNTQKHKFPHSQKLNHICEAVLFT